MNKWSKKKLLLIKYVSAERRQIEAKTKQSKETAQKDHERAQREKERLATLAANRQKVEMQKIREKLSKDFYRLKKSARPSRS